MRRIREVLRLRFELSRSHREISTATNISKGAVHEYLRRALASGVTWDLARELTDVELEARLYTKPNTTLPVDRVPIDLQWVHREMRRKAMTLQLLWVEYRDAARHDDEVRKPYQYSQFCAPRRGRRMARMASALTSLSSHLAVGSRASDYGESACCRERGWAMMEARTV